MADRSITIHNCAALIDGTVTDGTTIEIVDGVITAITPSTDATAGPDDIDANGLLAMPGFINTHTHAAMTLLRGAAEDVPIDEWFNDYVWPIEVNVTAEDVYLGTMLSCAEMIQAGVTNFADHYFFEEQAATAVIESGMRANLGLTFFSSQGPQGLEASTAFAEQWNGSADGRISTSLAPHGTYTCEDDDLRGAAEAARRLGVKVHIHAAEILEQTNASLERRGITPIALLEETGILDAGAIIAHGCGILDQDLPLLEAAADRIGVAHCPKGYLKHAIDPLTPIRALHAVGVAVGLGTDGPASCNSIDLFENMRLTSLTQKQATRDATWLTNAEALELAGPGSAKTIGVGAGRLAVGAKGDVILVDLGGVHCQPVHDPLAALVYSARSDDVRTTIVDGVPVMVDRELLTIDVPELVERVSRRAPELLVTKEGQSIQTYDP